MTTDSMVGAWAQGCVTNTAYNNNNSSINIRDYVGENKGYGFIDGSALAVTGWLLF